LLLSFHGVPRSTLLKGDPYHCQCQKTGRLLAEALELDDDAWLLTFQSRVGREQWLTPYTDETIKSLGASGASSLDVICPGFSTDCLETLEEIAMQNAEFFIEAGGKSLQYIPCLNASDAQIGLLGSVIDRHLLGWETLPDEASRLQTRARAEAMGADQ
jgi:ferrochelatase